MPGLLLSNPQQIIPDPPTSQKLLLGFPWYGDKFLTGHGIPQKCSQKCSEHLLCLEIVSKDLKVIGLALPASAAAMPTMKRLCCVCEQTVGFNRPQLTESETSGLHSSGGGMIATFKVMFTYAFGLCFSNMCSCRGTGSSLFASSSESWRSSSRLIRVDNDTGRIFWKSCNWFLLKASFLESTPDRIASCCATRENWK